MTVLSQVGVRTRAHREGVSLDIGDVATYLQENLGQLAQAVGEIAPVVFSQRIADQRVAKAGQIPGATPDTPLSDCHVVGDGTAEGGASMGTFYTTKHWDSLLDRYFTIHHTAPRGLFGHQSYSLVSKKPVIIDRTSLYGQYARSLERELFSLRKQHQVYY